MNTINKFLIYLEDNKVLEYLISDELMRVLLRDLPWENKHLLKSLLRITYNII